MDTGKHEAKQARQHEAPPRKWKSHQRQAEDTYCAEEKGPSFALVELFGIHMRTMELEVFHNWLDLVSICSKVAKAMSLNTGVKCLMRDPLCETCQHHY